MCTPSLNRTEANVDLKSVPVSIGVARRHVRMATMRSEARPHDLPTIKAEQRIEVSVIVENGLKCALTATWFNSVSWRDSSEKLAYMRN